MLAPEADRQELPQLSAPVPARALAFSLVALGVAGLASLVWPASLEQLAALVWLLALVPCFLLAYYRGWEGAAGGLAAAMALLILMEIVPKLIGGRVVDWRIAGGITVAFILGSLGAGALAELLRRQNFRALQLAYSDALTGLSNRRVLDFFLNHQFAAAQRGAQLSVVLFDIDRFKEYNDRFGHQAGDEALRSCASVLRSGCRASDLCGRYGGEEFLAVLPGTDLSGAVVFADRIRTAIARHELPTGERLTVSGGVATFDPSIVGPQVLVAAADAALYTAKAAGRNRIEPSPAGADAAQG